MSFYECVFIARPDISTQQVEGLTEQFSNILSENGGKAVNTEYWGLRNLAYRIKKNRKGHYVMMNLDTPSDALLEMERNMRLNEDLIRILTVRVEKLEEGPSIVMQSRNTRDDRGGRGGPRGRHDNTDGPRGPRREHSEKPDAAKTVEKAAPADGDAAGE